MFNPASLVLQRLLRNSICGSSPIEHSTPFAQNMFSPRTFLSKNLSLDTSLILTICRLSIFLLRSPMQGDTERGARRSREYEGPYGFSPMKSTKLFRLGAGAEGFD